MNTKIVARIIALLSILVGITVCIGWYLDITILTSISPNWIRMKTATALCFIFSGIILYFLTYRQEERKDLKQVVLTIFPMLIILIMGTLFLSSVFVFQTGLENISFVDRHEVATPIFQGRPAMPTMINFVLIAILGFIYNFNFFVKKLFYIFGAIIGILGAVGVVGYITGVPFLTFEIPGVSNAIAIQTTILFALIGLSIMLIGISQNKSE